MLLAVTVGTLLAPGTAGCGLLSGDSGEPAGRPAPTVTVSRPPRVAVVTYEVTGTGRLDITYADPATMKSVILEDQDLPWRIDLPRQPVTFVSILASRETYEEPSQHVRVLLDGVELCADTKEGWGYKDAGCMELVPSP